MHIDTSIQIVWAIANTEANHAGDVLIRPVHFFLGILKLIDPHFQRQLDGVNLPEGGRNILAQNGKKVRHYLEMPVDEITCLRRRIRKKLREGTTVRKRSLMLHRSEDALAVFKVASAKAIEADDPCMSVTQLVEALFETGSINLEKFKGTKRRPGSSSEN